VEKNMILKTTVTDVLKIKFVIHNVPLEVLKRDGNCYSLKYQDGQYTFMIRLKGASFNFIENCRLNTTRKKARNPLPFLISRNFDRTINIGLQMNASRVSDHIFAKGPLIIDKTIDQRGSYYMKISGQPEELFAQIQHALVATRQPKGKDKQQNDSSINHRKNLEINLKSTGIYLVHPGAFKRCENCANNTGTNCSVHNVEVSVNHRCSRFYSYKTVYGGGFSSK
jgi:hypothetical protein